VEGTVATAPAALVALRCRTSDHTGALVRGVDELAPLVGQRLGVEPRSIGSPSPPRVAAWDEDLRDSRGCLLEAGGQPWEAWSAPPCSRRRPDARVLWLDAHADFNTPGTSDSGYLSGMSLAGACGLWETGFEGSIQPDRVVLTGARDLDGGERELLERSPVTAIGASLEALVATQTALDRAPVYVHLDLDVLDPNDFPAEFPTPGGLSPDKLYDLLEAVAGECELVGLELAAFYAPEDDLERRAAASTALGAIEPLLESAHGGAHGGD
jgi:arginase